MQHQGLACAGTFLFGASLGAPRDAARLPPMCNSCSLASNTFPINDGCLGNLTESTSCSVSGDVCVSTGVVEWLPANTPNCLDPSNTTDLQVFDEEIRGTLVHSNAGSPQSVYNQHTSYLSINGNAIPAGNYQTGSKALGGHFKCGGGAYTITVSGILDYCDITSPTTCTCNCSIRPNIRVDKKWTCQ